MYDLNFYAILDIIYFHFVRIIPMASKILPEYFHSWAIICMLFLRIVVLQTYKKQ